MPTRNTTKHGLAFSIGLVAAATHAAPPRGVARVNGRACRPCEQRLVGDKPPKLPKGPVVLTGAVRVPNFYPFPDALELLGLTQRLSALGSAEAVAVGTHDLALLDFFEGCRDAAAIETLMRLTPDTWSKSRAAGCAR